MVTGPVQLIVLGFRHPDFRGEILDELERLREHDAVRVIDALAVYKDREGALEIEHLSQLTPEEAAATGSPVATLAGIEIEGDPAPAAGDGAAGGEEGQELWDVLADIPEDCAAALVLLEHRWAIPLRDAIARAGGFRIDDGFISAADLSEIGLMTREEAERHQVLEQAGAGGAG